MIKLRSYGACWTCRIRKVKCDETSIACEKCNSLRITCHGYGKKPAWIDGGQREREEMEKIKQKIKETNKMKRLLRNPKNRSSQLDADTGSFPNIAEVPLPRQTLTDAKMSCVTSHRSATVESIRSEDDDDSEEDGSTGSAGQIFSPLSMEHDFSRIALPRVSRTPDDVCSPALRLLHRQHESPVLSSLNERESCILMHYLDFVFPLQFPFYRPQPAEGGRGWLLSLILGTPAFFHAVLSVSEYHIQASTTYDSVTPYGLNILEDMERHHTLALTALRRHIADSESTRKTNDMMVQIGSLGCMIQLISFEVLRGDNNNWETHLQGARALAQDMKSCYAAPTSTFRTGQSNSVSMYRWNDELLEPVSLSQSDLMALDFFMAAFVCFDTLSCATTGSQPSCPGWLLPLLYDESGRIQLSKLMGYKNWVIAIIMEVAGLENWKMECQQNGSLSMRELARRATCIEQRLNNCLARNAKAMTLSPEIYQDEGMELETRSVTNVFGCAALTYLHVVLSGAYPELPEIRESVQRTIDAFRALRESHWVHNLIWPFCIAGCMAMPPSEGEFRGIAQSAKLRGRGFKNLETAVEIVKECWAARIESSERVSSPCNWKTAMKRLGISVLLI